MQNATEWTAAKKAGYADVNGDGYIDEYDIFLKQYDASRDLAVSKPEFTSGSTGRCTTRPCSPRSTRSAGR